MMGTEDDDATSEEGMSQVCSPLHFYFIFLILAHVHPLWCPVGFCCRFLLHAFRYVLGKVVIC